MTSEWVDLHNHVIPGVDDGARDVENARTAMEALAADGVSWVVATPHLDGSLTGNPPALARRLAELDAGWARLRETWSGDHVRLGRGAEIRLDVPEVDLSDDRLRLEGGAAVLVEFPYMTVPPRSAAVLMEIGRQGYLPVLAHPERYEAVDRDQRVVESWLDAGAMLQVNSGAVVGRYGERARSRALELLARGWVHCLASDYHANGPPGLGTVRRLLESWGGADTVRILFEENPTRLLRGEPCVGVPPLAPARTRSRWSRILPWS